MAMQTHVIFWASGAKGKEVRADGKGWHLARGHYFINRDGETKGPYKSVRIAAGARDADLNQSKKQVKGCRMEYVVAIIEHGTGRTVRTFPPYSMRWDAECLERGLLIDIDRERFDTEIREQQAAEPDPFQVRLTDGSLANGPLRETE
jgi:hypothetical protein